MIFMHFEGLFARGAVVLACITRGRSHAWSVAFESLDPVCAAVFRDALARDDRLSTPRAELLARAEAAKAERDHAIAEKVRIVVEYDRVIAALERAASASATEAAALRAKVAELEGANLILRSYVSGARR